MEQRKKEREKIYALLNQERGRWKGVTRPGPEPVREKSTLRRLHPE